MIAILVRELRLSVRHGADTLAALLFFLLIVSLFPLAIGPAPETLGRIAPGIIWVSALLSAFLSLDRLFGADFEDGSLDQLLLSGTHGIGIAAAKTLAHWIVTGLPLLLAAAPLAVMLRMPSEAIPAMLAGLLPGTMLLSLFGATGAAIVVGARRSGMLLPLLVLPLVTPVLIFGVAAADAAATGLSPTTAFVAAGGFAGRCACHCAHWPLAWPCEEQPSSARSYSSKSLRDAGSDPAALRRSSSREIAASRRAISRSYVLPCDLVQIRPHRQCPPLILGLGHQVAIPVSWPDVVVRRARPAVALQHQAVWIFGDALIFRRDVLPFRDGRINRRRHDTADENGR